MASLRRFYQIQMQSLSCLLTLYLPEGLIANHDNIILKIKFHRPNSILKFNFIEKSSQGSQQSREIQRY